MLPWNWGLIFGHMPNTWHIFCVWYWPICIGRGREALILGLTEQFWEVVILNSSYFFSCSEKKGKFHKGYHLGRKNLGMSKLWAGNKITLKKAENFVKEKKWRKQRNSQLNNYKLIVFCQSSKQLLQRIAQCTRFQSKWSHNNVTYRSNRINNDFGIRP